MSAPHSSRLLCFATAVIGALSVCSDPSAVQDFQRNNCCQVSCFLDLYPLTGFSPKFSFSLTHLPTVLGVCTCLLLTSGSSYGLGCNFGPCYFHGIGISSLITCFSALMLIFFVIELNSPYYFVATMKLSSPTSMAIKREPRSINLNFDYFCVN